MLKKLKGEIKIAGANFFLVSGAFAAFLTALAILAGDLMDYSAVGFEVLFPFYTAMAASEWGKTRADRNFPVIAAQSPSMFSWVFLRWLAAGRMLYACLRRIPTGGERLGNAACLLSHGVLFLLPLCPGRDSMEPGTCSGAGWRLALADCPFYPRSSAVSGS